ncbi:MAG: hypothetical protein DHS20C13_06240 [Thermodesulfobacteriota bacterium]|nr:MAG: hypothetical protein DHS20C13_06240 [Thermodesulfobacteriota bacterium]
MASLSGEELFIENRCVRCHTIGRGKFVGPDLANVNNKYTEEEIIKWIENPQQIYQSSGKMPFNEGYPPMPPMNVPPAQAQAIKDYILSVDIPEGSSKTGSISGQVLNKTSEGPAPGVELTLTSYMGDRPTDEKTIKSDDQGNFSFDNLNWDRSYQIAINFKGAQYATDKMVFFPNEETKILNLPIFEPTVEEDDISVVESHMIVQAGDGVLSVADLTLFDNSGDKIYVGGKELNDGRKESLRFNTPKGAQSLNFIHGINPDDIVQTAYGFADTTSIMPGQKRVVYTYDLPLSSGSTKFDKTIDYPTSSFLLLISDLERTAEVKGLTGGESVQIQGESFLKWTATDLEPGQQIKVELKTPIAKIEYIKWGAILLLLLIVIVGVVYSLVSNNKTIANNQFEEDRVEDLKEKRIELLKEIASLDDSFEAGQIDEQKYRNIREMKKEEVKKVTRRL